MENQSVMTLIFMLIIFVVMYFLMIRPHMNKAKKFNQKIRELKKSDTLINCDWCMADMPQNALVCQQCGKERKNIYEIRKVVKFIVAILIVLIAGSLLLIYSGRVGLITRSDLEAFFSFVGILFVISTIGLVYYKKKLDKMTENIMREKFDGE